MSKTLETFKTMHEECRSNKKSVWINGYSLPLNIIQNKMSATYTTYKNYENIKLFITSVYCMVMDIWRFHNQLGTYVLPLFVLR